MKNLARRSLLFMLVGIMSFGSANAQQSMTFKSDHPKGLIPHNAEQEDKILTTWPRVERVQLNWLGLERINKIRALKGKLPLDRSTARPVGREVEVSIHVPGRPVLAAAADEEILGDLPVSVDNSLLQYFPPIRSQGAVGSCVSFATTYYQLSYMTAFERGLDIRDPDDNTNKYSPKWTYNFVNHGYDGGSTFDANYYLIQTHGAATWAEFPYDDNYLAWCLDTAAWRNALGVKPQLYQYAADVSTDAGLELAKELLNNGYIIVFGTYIDSWQGTIIQDDPSTPDDDAEVGKIIGYWVNGYEGPHGMTVVGYNDAIWTDVNSNGTIEAGEKGAFRVANSWGTEWMDGGFVWAAYDALRSVSAVPGAPSEGRIGALQQDRGYLLTPRDNYTPTLIGEFTINHAKRYQLALATGRSGLSVIEPETGWIMFGLYQQGGNYAFDGTTTACDATFVFDFTDIAVSGEAQRYYLCLEDQLAGDPGRVSYFKLIDTTTGEHKQWQGGYVDFDNGYAYPYVEYTFNGPDYNHPPVLTYGYISPTVGDTNAIYSFYVYYSDYDYDTPAVSSVYIDDVPHTMTPYSGSTYRYQTTLGVGTHTFRFHFEDGNGGTGQYPPSGATIEGPVVGLPHNVLVPSIPSGDANPARAVSYTYSTGGSACDQAHDVQYRFDWGDGAITDWLPVGVASASHAWSSSGPFLVRAQARCSVNTAVVSAWSAGLSVTVAFTVPLTASFPTSSFPVMWTQQNIGAGITNRWSVRSTNYAGGKAYEMRCAYQDVNPATTRLVTPPINTAGHSTLRLRFKHYLNAYSAGCTLKIQTSHDGATWTDETWVIESSDIDVKAETVDTVLAHNIGISSTYVAFVVTGNLYAFDYWYIDDVLISGSSIKVDFNKDGQEDLLWRCYGTEVMYGVPGTGWDVVWYMGETGGLAPLTLGGRQSMAEAILTPMEVGGMQTAGPERAIVSPMDVGSPRAVGAERTFASPMDVRKAKITRPIRTLVSPGDAWKGEGSKQEKSNKSVGESRRRIAPVNSLRTKMEDITGDTVLQDTEGLVAGDAKLMAIDYGSDALLYTVTDLSWEIAGAGDFDGNGTTDVLWRYYGAGQGPGTTIIWFMDETTISSQGYPYRVSDTDWRIDRTGDFNGDGRADILWRYYGTGGAQGTTIIWYMNGATIIGQGYPYRVTDTDWKIDGIGDFNGDGRADLLWRYNGTGGAQGTTIIWYMDGTTILSQGYPYRVTDTDWKIDGVGYFDNDAKADIVWRYYGTGAGQGTTIIWYMNGAEIKGQDGLYRVPYLDWRIVNR